MKSDFKKILSSLLLIAVLLSSAPVLGNSLFSTKASAKVYGDILTYNIEDNQAIIEKCDTKASGELTIPSEIEGYPVTTISPYAFWNCTELSGKLVLPDTIITIDDGAFENCSGLSGTITLPDSVTTIGKKAFADCSGLTGDITIPKNVSYISYLTFCQTGIENIYVVNSNKYYSSDNYGVLFNKKKTELVAYPTANKRTNYSIPNTVKSIFLYAFYKCKLKGSLTIPNGVEKIREGAFSYSEGFTGNLNIPNSVTTILSYAFTGCENFTGLTLGNNVKEIYSSAFESCKNMTGVLTLPKSIKYIDYMAFSETPFTYIHIDSSNKYYSTDSYGALFDKSKKELFQYPCGNNRTAYSIPSTVTILLYNSFSRVKSLEYIVIPKSVTYFACSVFEFSPNLKKIYYTGTKKEWGKIEKEYNVSTKSIKVNYNYKNSLPLVPANIKPSATSSSSIKVSWSKVSGTKGYYVYQSLTGKAGSWTRKAVSGTSYTATGLKPYTKYYFCVRACNSNGVSGTSNINSARTKLATPSSVAVKKASSTSIKTSWKSVSNATGYQVYRATSKNGTYSKVKTTTSLSYTNTGLEKGKTYYYKVRAYKSLGNDSYTYSSLSSPKSVKL